jgi:hypothetical protein
MPLLLDCRAKSIEGILTEFERRGISSEQAEIVLSVGAYGGPDGRLIPIIAASTKVGTEVFAIPLAPFGSFDASLLDGTPIARTEIWILHGAQILSDRSVKLRPQEGFSDGVLVTNLRFSRAISSYDWSEFDSYVLKVALKGSPYTVFRKFAAGILDLTDLDFARVSRVKVQRLKNLLNGLEDHLQGMWERDDILTAEGRVAFRIWQGRSSLRQAIARTLRESGMKPSREQGYGRRPSPGKGLRK